MSTLKEDFPISLKHIEHILTRVHERYPALTRYEITIIAKSFFETIRSLLIEQNTISINGFAANMKLIFFSKFVKNKHCKTAKIKLTTPGIFK